MTPNKLNSIIKKYRSKLDQYNKEWETICRIKCKKKIEGDKIIMTTPSIYDHEQYNSKGANLFRELMKELEGYDVFKHKK